MSAVRRRAVYLALHCLRQLGTRAWRGSLRMIRCPYGTAIQTQPVRPGVDLSLLRRGIRADAQLLTFTGDPGTARSGAPNEGSYLAGILSGLHGAAGDRGRSYLQRPDFQALLPDALRTYAAAGVR